MERTGTWYGYKLDDGTCIRVDRWYGKDAPTQYFVRKIYKDENGDELHPLLATCECLEQAEEFIINYNNNPDKALETISASTKLDKTVVERVLWYLSCLDQITKYQDKELSEIRDKVVDYHLSMFPPLESEKEFKNYGG